MIEEDNTADPHIAESKILAAKVLFMGQQPYFGGLLGQLRFQIIKDDRVTTCASNGETIFFNYDYIMKHNIQELIFTIGHELLHCVLNHYLRGPSKEVSAWRGGNENEKLWSMACDYAVNSILVDGGIGKRPKKALYNKQYRGMTAEEIYELLDTHLALGHLSLKTVRRLRTIDDHTLIEGKSIETEDPSETINGMSESRAALWGETFEEALRSDQGDNTVFGKPCLSKSLFKIYNPDSINNANQVTEWKEELSIFIRSKFLTDLTYLRPLKKTQSLGITLPSLKLSDKLNIAIALDTSGSIELKELEHFLGEVGRILEAFDSFVVHLWCFDTSIHNYVVLDSNNDDVRILEDYQLIGGGGTDFEINWAHMDSEGITPDLFLMLTDGEPCEGWGDADSVPTLFAIIGDKKRRIRAPFGTTIYLN